MYDIEKASIVLHTRNRPTFLLRAIDYYTAVGPTGMRIIVSDASDEKQRRLISEGLGQRTSALNLTVLHHSPSDSFPHRIAEALALLSTPYVMLAADDDVYLLDELKPAIKLLETDPSFGVVYGHTLEFEVHGGTPHSAFGTLSKCYPAEYDNPPPRWLEGATPQDRLRELGNPTTDTHTVGWYALQRTELLGTIVGYAAENHFDGYLFEKFLIYCQAALCRTRMTEGIHLARQANPAERRPPCSFRALSEGLEQLKKVVVRILVQHMRLSEPVATHVTNDAFRGDIAQLKRADSKRHLRAIADALPLIRVAQRALSSRFGTRQGNDALDSRFPAPPLICPTHPAVETIRKLVSGGFTSVTTADPHRPGSERLERQSGPS